MEPLVDQGLGDIDGMDAVRRLFLRAQDALVHAGLRIRNLVKAFEGMHDVIGVQHRIFTYVN